MKKFQFKFSAILKINKIREDEALRSLALQEKKFQQEINKKQKLVSDLSQAFSRREDLGKTPVGISAFKVEQDCISGLKLRISQADYAIFKAKKNVDRAHSVFTAARTKTRIMETLYEKAHAEYKKEIAKQEQKAMDELVLMRFRLQEGKL